MIWFTAVEAQVVITTTLFLSFIQWWSDTAAKCEWSMIASGCGDHSCGQGWADGRLGYWSGSRGSWWVTECEETKIIAALGLLIIRHTAERRGIFHIHSSVTDSSVEFVHKICLSHEFNELKGHQQPDLIEEILNEDCFKSLIIKVVMFNSNSQKLNIIFLKTAILLLAGLQFKSNFYDWIWGVI